MYRAEKYEIVCLFPPRKLHTSFLPRRSHHLNLLDRPQTRHHRASISLADPSHNRLDRSHAAAILHYVADPNEIRNKMAPVLHQYSMHDVSHLHYLQASQRLPIGHLFRSPCHTWSLMARDWTTDDSEILFPGAKRPYRERKG